MRQEGASISAKDQPGALGVWSRRLGKLYSGSAVLFWPITDAAMRLFIALHFLRSGLVKAGNWDTAVLLATEEYPVDWMTPEAAAATGLGIELVAPVLLFLGLFTRPAAAALAILTIVAQAVYIPTTTNLMLIAMLVWYVAAGAAAISLDALWVSKVRKAVGTRGAAIVHMGRAVRYHVGPYLVLALRVWLGGALLALAGMFEPPIALATWLPITSFSGLPPWLAIVFAALLITGTAASPVSYALTFVIAAFMISGAHPDVTFYPVLLLGLYEARGAGPLSVDRAVERWFKGRFGTGETTPCPDDPEVWLATLRQWWTGGREFAGKALRRRLNQP